MSSSEDIKLLVTELHKSISKIQIDKEPTENGIISRVSDGVAWVYGLQNVGFHETLEIEANDGSILPAFALSLMEDEVGAVILGDDSLVSAGASVSRTGKNLSIPVGNELIGRVVDPLGNPLDGKGEINTQKTGLIERPAPGILDRRGVYEPLLTGITAIDAMIPIGRGQRELIIGDRQTGKTAIALDTMINQRRIQSDIINIYVAIGQKNTTIARLIDKLEREDAMKQSIVVATSAADSAALQYIAPYAGCAIGEWFRDNSRHALITYDDLSKHAVAYRQISLLLKRPPGREAFPGDVFYLHSRLLERAAKMSDEKGSGSLTALPIIETQGGDVSAYIPTNVISITDGQIYLETDLFYQGIRPAVSVGLSVSRVGSAAQPEIIKSSAKSLRVTLAQFRELAAFSQFGSELDEETRARIIRGQLLTELLKQPQYSPLPTWKQVAMLHSANMGAFDNIPLESLASALGNYFNEISDHHEPLVKSLNTLKSIDSQLETALQKIANESTKAYQKQIVGTSK